ncbi:glycoside hydrolase family 9 protein [Clostridium cellulovorans]|uniref:Glycoside hydrolase family 9 n=1 Tax=Clostridium cellulovorans (strain ATCC 35296 / DSM 3052 / OCM 3 / 743B) TaxID=573061 RepID=D9SX09_CLOC7|nr:glycoside hydrolase family 9 protein [Clostridium cellulovorans]ADL51370.1 glycoside hydrolase family 9 [Clostridium cellulovorans 743B]
MKNKKIMGLVLAASLTASVFTPILSVNADTTVSRKLMDLEVFKSASITGWSGSAGGELEVASDSNLPIDTSATYNGLPSLRLNVTKASAQWWSSLLTLRGWCTQDLTQYLANGYLEFNVKGKVGGEDFQIGLQDQTHERAAGDSVTSVKSIKNYVNISTNWQHVKIPLKDIMGPSTGFDPTTARCINIVKGSSEIFTAWINDLKITSTDNEKSYAPIKVNQDGYLPSSEKYALVSGFSDELNANAGSQFQVKDATTNAVVYSGTLTLASSFDSDSGEKILKGDFSSVTTPGTYYISVPDAGNSNSVKFKIASDVYKNLLFDSQRYFFYQRQGIELKAPYVTDYPRTDETPNDAIAQFESGTQPAREITKGWYDAGDKGKYINNGALAVSNMFWAYEMFPETLKDNQFNIPESGNGVVDILDEARWEVEWILKMQDSVSGGFYARVQSKDGKDGDSSAPRIIKDGSTNIKSTDDTACAAAILAHSYIMFKNIDPTFANKCLEAAKSAWSYLEKNPTNIVSPSGPYNVYNDSSDRLWAAASLLRATNEDKYNTYFLNNYSKFSTYFRDANGYGHNWGDMWTTAFWCYLKADKKDSNAVSWIKTEFSTWLDNKISRTSTNPWQISNPTGSFFWGINSNILLTWEDAIIGSKLLGTYSDTIAKQTQASLNWILGVNPLRKSFVTGHGEDSTKKIYHVTYSADGKAGVPNGYLAGGINASEGKTLSNFPGKCYIDSDGDWVTNENCLNWNASLVFISTFVNSSTPTSYKLGDLNNDGKINAIDMALMKKGILGGFTDSATQLAGDVNKDGKTNAIDLALIKKYILGQINSF